MEFSHQIAHQIFPSEFPPTKKKTPKRPNSQTNKSTTIKEKKKKKQHPRSAETGRLDYKTRNLQWRKTTPITTQMTLENEDWFFFSLSLLYSVWLKLAVPLLAFPFGVCLALEARLSVWEDAFRYSCGVCVLTTMLFNLLRGKRSDEVGAWWQVRGVI